MIEIFYDDLILNSNLEDIDILKINALTNQGDGYYITRMYINVNGALVIELKDGTHTVVDIPTLTTNSKLEWKLLGVYNAQSGVNVSDVDAREFFVIHSKDTLCIEHQFPANMGNAEMYGGFYNSASSFIGETLTYVDGVIYGRVFVASGTDHSASAIIQVYYR